MKASLSRGTARDEKLQQTMNLTLKRLNTYQQVGGSSFSLGKKEAGILLKGLLTTCETIKSVY